MPETESERRKREARERFDQLMLAALALFLFGRFRLASELRAFALRYNQEVERILSSALTFNLPRAARETLRDDLQEAFDATSRRLARLLEDAPDLDAVQGWFERMTAALHSHTVAQFSLGVGRSLLPTESLALAEALRFHQEKLEGFARDVVRAVETNRPMSVEAVASRSSLYGGVGRAVWYRGDELGAPPGIVIDYVSRDDAGTCEPCLIAEDESPYLPGEGPYPGAVCKGRGRCRCERTPRPSFADYARLVATLDRRSRFLEF